MSAAPNFGVFLRAKGVNSHEGRSLAVETGKIISKPKCFMINHRKIWPVFALEAFLSISLPHKRNFENANGVEKFVCFGLPLQSVNARTTKGENRA